MWYETCKLGLAIFFTGLAIKLSDDFLDRKEDAIIGKHTLGAQLGDAVLPYAVLCILVACYFSAPLSISLYLAGYGVGMVKDPQVKYFTRLSGWQEIGITFILSTLFVEFRATLLAWIILFTIQCIDDLVDYKREPANTNLVHRLGLLETIVIMLIAIGSAWWISPRITLMAMGAFVLIEFFWSKVARGIGVQSWKT